MKEIQHSYKYQIKIRGLEIQELWTKNEDKNIEDENQLGLDSTMNASLCKTLYTGDKITLDEIQDVLKQIENQKAAGITVCVCV